MNQAKKLQSLQDLVVNFIDKLPQDLKGESKGFSALILDSNQDAARELENILSNIGCKCDLVATLREAKDKVRKNSNYSLVIAEPRPAGSSETEGISFLSNLKMEYPGIIPILTVSFTESEDAVGALRKNILGFFIKPYKEHEVIKNLNELLSLYDRKNYLVMLLQMFVQNFNSWKEQN
ncbi:MAG: response regulator [Myxococcota bacterium]